jgi:hypothetical protein
MIRECIDSLIVGIHRSYLSNSLGWSFVTIRVGRVEMEVSVYHILGGYLNPSSRYGRASHCSRYDDSTRSCTHLADRSIVSSIGRLSIEMIRRLSTRMSIGLTLVVSLCIRIRHLSVITIDWKSDGDILPIGVITLRLASCGSTIPP